MTSLVKSDLVRIRAWVTKDEYTLSKDSADSTVFCPELRHLYAKSWQIASRMDDVVFLRPQEFVPDKLTSYIAVTRYWVNTTTQSLVYAHALPDTRSEVLALWNDFVAVAGERITDAKARKSFSARANTLRRLFGLPVEELPDDPSTAQIKVVLDVFKAMKKLTND